MGVKKMKKFATSDELVAWVHGRLLATLPEDVYLDVAGVKEPCDLPSTILAATESILMTHLPCTPMMVAALIESWLIESWLVETEK
jgi:hypothetical protein